MSWKLQLPAARMSGTPSKQTSLTIFFKPLSSSGHFFVIFVTTLGYFAGISSTLVIFESTVSCPDSFSLVFKEMNLVLLKYLQVCPLILWILVGYTSVFVRKLT